MQHFRKFSTPWFSFVWKKIFNCPSSLLYYHHNISTHKNKHKSKTELKSLIKRNETSCLSSKHLLFLKVSCSALPEITDCIKSGEMETEGRGDDDDDMNDDAAFPSGQNDYISRATFLLLILASQTRLYILQDSIQTALGCKQSQGTK